MKRSFSRTQPSIPSRLRQMPHLPRPIRQNLQQKRQHPIRIASHEPTIHLLGKYPQNANTPFANRKTTSSGIIFWLAPGVTVAIRVHFLLLLLGSD